MFYWSILFWYKRQNVVESALQHLYEWQNWEIVEEDYSVGAKNFTFKWKRVVVGRYSYEIEG